MSQAAIRNRQTEASECGLACLAMCADMLGSKTDLASLRQRQLVSSRGSTLADLAQIASTMGLSTRAIRCELGELKNLQRPTILHWGLDHFVVLDRVRRSNVRIFDPATGYRTLRLPETSKLFTGVALEIATTPAFQKRRERTPLKLSSVLRWTPAIRSTLLQTLILSLLLQAYVVASPFYMQLSIDEAALKGDQDLLTALAVGFGLFAAFNAGAEALRGVALQRASSLLSWDMTQRLFHHMIRLPLPWFQRRRLADALTRFQSLDPIKNLIANGLVGSLIDGLLSIATALMMVLFAPVLAAITLVSLALYIAVRLVGIPFTMRLSSDALTASIAEQGKRIETLRAIQTIKIMTGEVQRESDWANKFADTVRTNQASAFATLGFSTVQRLLDALASVLIVYLAVRAIIDGRMTVGVLYAFMSYRSQFMQRSISLFEQVVSWRMLDVYTFRLSDVVLTPVEKGIDAAPMSLGEVQGSIELDRVSFRYGPTEPWILKDINLKVEVGEFVAIVGPSGAGKSTLLKVLCGLYPATLGEVRLDGLPISHWGPNAMRAALGVVLQDDELLPGSIAENVAFFDSLIDAERIWDCLRLAHVDAEVRAMPMGVETFVGDLGSALSGGQRQRVLLARAFYRRGKVFVLDEATSSLDAPLDRALGTSLAATAATRIVVAHRPETIASATRVLLLRNGLHELQSRPSVSTVEVAQ